MIDARHPGPIPIALGTEDQTPFEQARAALLGALEECRPILEAESPPTSISFILPIDALTGRPRKAIWRMEGERDLTGRHRPAYRPQ